MPSRICPDDRWSWVEVDLAALRRNTRAFRSQIERGVRMMCVVKADAYGHGAVRCANVMRSAGADQFAVATVAEGVELREAGISEPILSLGEAPMECGQTLVEHDIMPSVYTQEFALALGECAATFDRVARYHLAVDTGMSRIGFQVTEADADICAEIAALPGLTAEGLFSHFATADSYDLSRARAQAERFDAFDAMLKRRGVRILIRHLNNSAGLMNFDHHYEMVRSGIVTYGLYPSDEVDTGLLPLTPAMRLLSRVSYVKALPPGREISYGGTFVTTRPTVVATVPIGYADGYRRSLSGKFYVLIHGKRAPILGRVCMDQMMVDVTDIPGVQAGDTVTLIGTDGDETISMEEIAAAAGSFNYEFACGISRRVPRVYLRGGQAVHTVHYLTDIFQEGSHGT